MHQDSLTGTSLVTSVSGASLGTIKYTPFGETRSGSVPTDKKFTGQRLDATGLYYYNARYYDATIGRFISPDTVISNPSSSQAFNRYSYVLNNPLRYNDPTGHFGEEHYGFKNQPIKPPPQPPKPSLTAFEGISFGPIVINAWRRNIIADVTINNTGGIKVAESAVSGTINKTVIDSERTLVSVNLYGNNTNTASDLHTSTTIVPNYPILMYTTTSEQHGQVSLQVPQDYQSYFAERNRDSSPEYWVAYTSGNECIPPIQECTEMKMKFVFHTADPGGWDWEGQPSFVRPYGFTIDLITNKVELLKK